MGNEWPADAGMRCGGRCELWLGRKARRKFASTASRVSCQRHILSGCFRKTAGVKNEKCKGAENAD